MQAFFSPAVALMNRLDVTRKFMLLGLMSQLISVSQRELKGIELIKPFPRTVQILQQHRGFSSGLLGGDETMRDRRASKEGEAVEALNEMWGKPFHGMALSEGLQHIKADWEHLRKEGLNWTVAENFAAHTRLIDRIQSFQGIVADEYTLTLDIELRTFYLIDTIINKLPQAIERLGRLRAYGTGILAKKRSTAQQKIEMNILIAELGDALKLLKTNLDMTGRYNPALQGLISAASRDITDSAQRITGIVASDILSGHFTMPPNDFFGMSTAVIDGCYTQLHEVLLPMAETLIKARIARAENTLHTSIGIAFLPFLAVAYFSIGICRVIIGNIRSLARSVHAFAGGDLRERVDLGARDEFGRVGDSFNEMADGFSALLKVSRENEARLHDLSAHLEERVKDRTIELERAQRETEALLQRNQALMLTSMDGIHMMDMHGNILAANDTFCRILGYTQKEVSGLNVADWDAQWSAEELRARFMEIIGKNVIFETLHRRKDGTLINVEISASGVELEGQNFFFASSRDITERKKTEEQLRIAATAFETHEAILITDANANIIHVNQAFTDITGYSPEEVLGKNPRILSTDRQDKAFYAAMWRQLLDTGSWTGEMWDRRKDGQIYPKWLTITAVKNEQQKTAQYVSIFSDITTRKQAEEEIRNLAFYDALTNLPNRRLMLDRFRLALHGSARSHQYGAVLFLDMDRFKTLNDTLGHDHGDLMLIEVARRIQACVREVDTVSRLGGDEFVVLIEEISTSAEDTSQKIALVAEKIRAALSAPYQLKGHEHHSSPSIGVCLYRGNEESVETLLKHADMAMYQAKDSGRNAVRFFDPAIQQAVEAHAALEADLRHAVPDQQLRLHYQIQVDNDHRPLGAEALARWTHPECGMILPGQFIPIAEESLLIIEVGNWVLETACRQLALWSKREQTRHLELAVNVSAQQFSKHDFVENVAAVIRAHQVNPARLKLELTESVVLTDVSDVVAKMHALKALGIKLSMDDFGTGYSSLSYLKQLPLDQIKIDQSFVHDIAIDNYDAVMVKTIIDMARSFCLNVVAEGVETEAQLNFLKQNGCMAYQGYLFSRPVPIEEFEALLGRS